MDVPYSTTISEVTNHQEFARRFSGFAQFQMQRPDVPVIEMTARNLAEKMAREVVKEQKFFHMHIGHDGYGTMKINAVVMTDEEYAAALRDAFQRGIKHALYFSTTRPGVG